MIGHPMYIENDRLIIRSLEEQDLKGLEDLRCDQRVYCYEPTFLMELQGTPESAIDYDIKRFTEQDPVQFLKNTEAGELSDPSNGRGRLRFPLLITVLSQINKMPLSSYTEAVETFPQRIARSSAMMVATAPSIFSVERSFPEPKVCTD